MADSALSALLRETRAALLTADLPKLGQLAEQIAAAFPPTGLRRTEAAAIRAAAAENAGLLQAALDGIRAARLRASEISAARDCATYGADGRRSAHPATGKLPPRRL